MRSMLKIYFISLYHLWIKHSDFRFKWLVIVKFHRLIKFIQKSLLEIAQSSFQCLHKDLFIHSHLFIYLSFVHRMEFGLNFVYLTLIFLKVSRFLFQYFQLQIIKFSTKFKSFHQIIIYFYLKNYFNLNLLFQNHLNFSIDNLSNSCFQNVYYQLFMTHISSLLSIKKYCLKNLFHIKGVPLFIFHSPQFMNLTINWIIFFYLYR